MNVVRLFTLSLLLLLLASSALAEPKKVVTVEGITEYQLDNGLKVLLLPDGSKPTVTVNLTVLVGSRHEGYGEGGMAHLLEHLVFKGTPTHPHPPQALRDRGASFNGTTWYDRTNYFETLPATGDNLEFALRFEADRFVNSFIRREDLLSEMTVVRNEFERGENSPAQLLEKRIMSVVYEWHGYGRDTIGNRSDIERVPIDRLQDFYKRYYQPDNAVLIVAGKFDESTALKLIEQSFGTIPCPERKLPTTYTEEPPQDGERQVTLRRVGDVGIVKAVYHIPAAAHEDSAALNVLTSILSMPPSGRLYKDLVETKKASSAYASAARLHDPGYLEVTANVRRENSLDEARDAMFGTLQKVASEGVTEEETNRAKQAFLNGHRRSTLDTSSLAVSLSNWIGAGDWRLHFLHRDRVEKVTPEDVKRVAAKYLVASNRTLGYFIPSEKPDLVEIPGTPDVTELVSNYKGREAVALIEEFDYSYANIEKHTIRTTLPSGVKAALLPKPTRDQEVQLSLSLRYGNAENLRSFREAASLLPDLMTRGTKNLTHQQLRDELTKLDVTLSASGQPGRIDFDVRARRTTLGPALELLRQVLREPRLEAEELEIHRRNRLASLEASRTEPSTLGRNLLTRTLNPYPPDDIRFDAPPEEDIAHVKAVTIEQVRKLHAEFLGGTEGELVVAGDFDSDATVKAIGEMLSDWKSSNPYARIERQAFETISGGKHSVNTPDKANANYMAGHQIAMTDRDPDYPALLLGNYVLGGSSLASRLGDRVRQKEGLSYGVSSSFNASYEDAVANFWIGAICNPANIGKVEVAVREEVEKLLHDGIPADEFEKARRGLLESRQRVRNSDSYVAGRLARTLRTEQTLEYEAQFDEKLKGLTPSEVLAVLKKRIDPKRLVVVVAGDFEAKGAN